MDLYAQEPVEAILKDLFNDMRYILENLIVKFENLNYLNVAFISYKLTMWD